jgi:hypothetical protein
MKKRRPPGPGRESKGAKGAVPKQRHKMCEGCRLKQPTFGLASEGKSRWCAGCGPEGAVSMKKQKMCEGR